MFASIATGRIEARPHPVPTPTPTPVPPPEDPAVTTIARHEFVSWQLGSVDKSRYTPEMQAKITDEALAQTSKTLSAVGALQKMDYVGVYAPPSDVPGGRAYLYHVICTSHDVFEILTIGPDGKIAGISFRDKVDGGS
jgi:cell division septation protein DedD